MLWLILQYSYMLKFFFFSKNCNVKALSISNFSAQNKPNPIVWWLHGRKSLNPFLLCGEATWAPLTNLAISINRLALGWKFCSWNHLLFSTAENWLIKTILIRMDLPSATIYNCRISAEKNCAIIRGKIYWRIRILKKNS